jgi:tRNA(adenine34) deaminase
MTEDAWMAEALAEAVRAETQSEVPIGAIVVFNDLILGRGYNRPIAQSDPTAHAEMIALRDAARMLDNYRLPGTTLYVTVEPCLMCMGALLHARVSRLVFGCYDPKAGAAGSLYNVANDPRLNHQFEVTAGIRADESRELLQRFFRGKRHREKD